MNYDPGEGRNVGVHTCRTPTRVGFLSHYRKSLTPPVAGLRPMNPKHPMNPSLRIEEYRKPLAPPMNPKHPVYSMNPKHPVYSMNPKHPNLSMNPSLRRGVP